MADERNECITNWLAAYCGDEEVIVPRAIAAIKQSREIVDDNGWDYVDPESENIRLLQNHSPAGIDNRSPSPSSVTRITTISTKTLRGMIEPISKYQFCMRAYLTDLDLESIFAEKVLAYLQTAREQEPQSEDDGPLLPVKDARVMNRDSMPSYSGAARVSATTFVGEVLFSDFACLELHGFAIFPSAMTDDDWKTTFLRELSKFLVTVDPT